MSLSKSWKDLSAALLLEAADQASERFVDLQIVLRQHETGACVMGVGGRWDRKERRYLDQDGKTGRVITIHEGQEEFFLWFKKWIIGYGTKAHGPETSRVYSALLAGGRRGGKSDAGTKAAQMFAVAVPKSIVWLVSPTQEETEELADVLSKELPLEWYKVRADKHRYTLANGSKIYLRSAHKPIALKRGRVDLVVLNEAQNMAEKSFVTVRAPIADTGGLVLAAVNPPEAAIGQWVLDWYVESQAKKRNSRLFEFDPERNPFVDKEALESSREDMDQETYDREILGHFKPIGHLVLSAFNARLNVLELPPELPDITRIMCPSARLPGADTIIVCDFQLTPHMAATAWRIYGTRDKPIAVCVGEVVVDDGTEDDLIDAIEAAGYDSASCVAIGDASGDWQDAERTKGGASFDAFRSRGWKIYKPDPEGQKNPDMIASVKGVNRLLCNAAGERRMFSLAQNDAMNKALARWPWKNGFPDRRSKYSHLCDTARYFAWRFWPNRKVVKKTGKIYERVERSMTGRAKEMRGAY